MQEGGITRGAKTSTGFSAAAVGGGGLGAAEGPGMRLGQANVYGNRICSLLSA